MKLASPHILVSALVCACATTLTVPQPVASPSDPRCDYDTWRLNKDPATLPTPLVQPAAVDSGFVYQLARVGELPKAFRAGWKAWVITAAVIDTAGVVRDVEIIAVDLEFRGPPLGSAPDPPRVTRVQAQAEYGDAAEVLTRAQKFSSPTVGGAPVNVWLCNSWSWEMER